MANARDRWRTLRRLVPRAPDEYRHLGRTLALAVAVGFAAGLGACLFHVGTELTGKLLLGKLVHFAPPRPRGEAVLAPLLGDGELRRWLLIVVPALGALVSGTLVWWLAPEAAGGGGDAYIDAFHNRQGRVRKRVAIVKGLASILILGSGGSAGREGPIMQIGSAIGSSLAQLLKLSDKERRLLLIAGTAAGMAAIFRTPLGAAIFAIEVLYRDDFEVSALVGAIIASVTSYSVFTTIFGEGHLFATSAHYPFQPLVLPLYLAMALVVSLGARGFATLLHGAREHFWKKLPTPGWLTPALGGLAMGAIAFAVPPVTGLGYGYLQDAILWDGVFPVAWRTVLLLLGVALAKMLATSCTISSGGSGGDFGPSLVIGGLLGSACGQTFHLLFPTLVTHPGAFALVGMATFFGGIAHVPLASLIMVCELTGSYELLVPLMFTEGLAFILLRRSSLYRAQVATQMSSPAHAGELTIDVLAALTVGHATEGATPPRVVTARASLRDFLREVAASDHAAFPVIDDAGTLAGVVLLRTVRALMVEDMTGAPLIVGDALSQVDRVEPETPLSLALDRLLASGGEALPVVEGGRFVAMLGFADIVRAYQRELARRRDQAATT